MAAFFIVSTLVIWGMFATTGLWLSHFFTSLNKWGPATGLPTLLTLGVLAGLTLTRYHYNLFTSILYYFSYVLLGAAFIAFCVTTAGAVLFVILKFLHMNIRTYLGMASVAVIFVLFIYALWGGFAIPKIKHIAVKIDNAPTLKIALISDAHLGMGVSQARWDKALARLEQQKPDLVLVLGDIFEYGPHADQYAERLAAFKTPLGTYGVLGNHEYYNGYQQALDFFQQANIRLLQNETVSLPNGLQIAGLKDITTAQVSPQDLTNLLAKADNKKPLILLSHTPLYAQEAAQGGADLMLSGHTHNGQIWPFNYLTRLRFPHVYGLTYLDGMPFYVTSGMFYWGIPLRLFSPAELPIIEVNL